MVTNGIHSNTHERKSTEEVLDLYWYALDESCPLVMVNEHGKITYLNNKFKVLTGYSLDDLQGPLTGLLFPGSHHEGFLDELAELIRSGRTWRRKICLRKRDGQAIGLLATFFSNPAMDLSRQHLLIFLPDISLHTGKDDPSKDPDIGFSNLARDLRNPLSNLTSLCGLLQDTPLDKKQKDYVSEIKRSTNLLSGMIDKLLSYSMENLPPILPVSLSFNIKKTIKEFSSLFSQQASLLGTITRLEVDENLPDEVYGDEKQLNSVVKQIINYLFSHPELHSLRISTLNEVEKDDSIEISFFFLGQYSIPAVGVPSPAEVKEQKASPELKEISSKIASLGGKVLLEEETRQAFYLHFSLPFRSSPAHGPLAEPEPPLPPETDFPADARILVAEDVELNQLVMKHQLQKISLEADFVRTGFNVLERLRMFPYDLVLMDIQMPGMNGLQTIEVIRSDQSKTYHRIPIIGITASIGGNAREQCLRAGADDFVPKPYDLDDLKNKLKKLIAAYRLEKTYTIEKPPKLTDMTPQEKCFDLSYLEEISEGDQEFSSTMISYFIDNTPSVMETLEKKVQEQDWEEIRQIAHKLKPQVVYMGIHQIEDDVEQIEHFAQHRESLEKIPVLVKKTATIIEQAIAQLKEELKKFN